jgi:hypothetical protein
VRLFSLLVAFAVSSLSFSAVLVPWSSSEGVLRLERSKAKADFFRLANHFETQKNRLFCGPASGVIVLNAFRLGNADLPADKATFDTAFLEKLPKDFSPFFPKYTQNNFFNEATESVKTQAAVCGDTSKGAADFGFQLRQYEKVLQAHGLKTKMVVVDEKVPLKKIRETLSKNMADSTNFAIVNYARKSLDQAGGGHLSPLGAYDKQSDSFLVMDVNPNTASWVWVKTKDLVAAMATKDTVENRGFVEVTD